jgi:hypothetical protein
MFARTSKIDHPLGVPIETPLLVPSFSSKGLGINPDGESEVKEIFSVVSEYLTDTMLISAFDLSYGHLAPIQSAITEITFIDSGGYEISDFYDLSAIYREQVSRSDVRDDWTEEKLHKIYKEWPEHIPAVFVNYDHPDLHLSLEEQINNAKRFFSQHPNQLHTLLIKPETDKQQYVQVNNVKARVEELKRFDIIGLTEKELGNKIIQRMENIASIRFAMDDAGVNKPLHIYGSLDPLTSVLYFLAGAEIFDGLTWLRYGYSDGMACYPHNYGVKNIGIKYRDSFIKAKTMRDNLSYLSTLTDQMRRFLLDEEFEKFGDNAKVLRDGYELLRTKNPRIK